MSTTTTSFFGRTFFDESYYDHNSRTGVLPFTLVQWKFTMICLMGENRKVYIVISILFVQSTVQCWGNSTFGLTPLASQKRKCKWAFDCLCGCAGGTYVHTWYGRKKSYNLTSLRCLDPWWAPCLRAWFPIVIIPWGGTWRWSAVGTCSVRCRVVWAQGSDLIGRWRNCRR